MTTTIIKTGRTSAIPTAGGYDVGCLGCGQDIGKLLPSQRGLTGYVTPQWEPATGADLFWLADMPIAPKYAPEPYAEAIAQLARLHRIEGCGQ